MENQLLTISQVIALIDKNTTLGKYNPSEDRLPYNSTGKRRTKKAVAKYLFEVSPTSSIIKWLNQGLIEKPDIDWCGY